MPGFRFPKFKDTVKKAKTWLKAALEKGKTIFLTCSSATGKPQELLHLVKGLGAPVYASPFSSNKLYTELGSDLGTFKETHYIRDLPKGAKIVIVHPSRKYGIITEKNCLDSCLGNASGLGYFHEFVMRTQSGRAEEEALADVYESLFASRVEEGKDAIHIPISDHSDYDGFLKLIKQTDPEEIYFPRSHFRVPGHVLKQIKEETGIVAKVI